MLFAAVHESGSPVLALPGRSLRCRKWSAIEGAADKK
jgi:hypothetical protein